MAKEKQQFLGYGALASTTAGGYVEATSALVGGAVQLARSVVAEGFRGVTLALSSAGLVKTIFDGKIGLNKDRLDTDNAAPSAAQIFACGDYYLPLNLQFSVNAQKITAHSQLVDGINIIERIAKGPKTISCNFVVERTPVATEFEKSGVYASARVVESAPLYVRKMNSSGDLKRAASNVTPINKLTELLQSIYENDDVFLVQNPVLNEELGVKYVYLQNYSITPQVGSTLFMVSMTMQEVNIADSILYKTAVNAIRSGEIGG